MHTHFCPLCRMTYQCPEGDGKCGTLVYRNCEGVAGCAKDPIGAALAKGIAKESGIGNREDAFSPPFSPPAPVADQPKTASLDMPAAPFVYSSLTGAPIEDDPAPAPKTASLDMPAAPFVYSSLTGAPIEDDPAPAPKTASLDMPAAPFVYSSLTGAPIEDDPALAPMPDPWRDRAESLQRQINLLSRGLEDLPLFYQRVVALETRLNTDPIRARRIGRPEFRSVEQYYLWAKNEIARGNRAASPSAAAIADLAQVLEWAAAYLVGNP